MVMLLPLLANADPGDPELKAIHGEIYDYVSGDRTPANLQYYFALAALNVIRSQCNDSNAYPQLTPQYALIFSDECYTRVTGRGTFYTMSFLVPSAIPQNEDGSYGSFEDNGWTGDENGDGDDVYVTISSSESIKSPALNSTDHSHNTPKGSNVTTTMPSIVIPRSQDPSGYANDFKFVG